MENNFFNFNKSRNFKIFLLILGLVISICLLPLLFPPVQFKIVKLVETLKNDDINDIFWMKQQFAFASVSILFIFSFLFFYITNVGNKLFCHYLDSFKEVGKVIKSNYKYILILFILYFFGYFTIFRANFWNIAIDDLARQIEGTREWMNWYRYISEFGSIFIHTSPRLIDIAPLTQIIALLLLSFSSFFLIYIFNKKFTFISCLASLPVGLFPYILSNISYRYDSPYMAFSVLVSIIPFLFFDDNKTFIFTSLVCLLLMCTSYQSSSGIYIFMCILCILSKILYTHETGISIIKKIVLCIILYAVTLILFSLIFMEKVDTTTYVNNTISIKAIPVNIKSFLSIVYSNFKNTIILILSISILIFFSFITINKSNKNKLISLILVLLTIVISIPFTFGSYLALEHPLFSPRAFSALGVLIACILIQCASFDKKIIVKRIISILIIYYSYSLLAFSFAYGNAQYDQNKYIDFRATLLLKDLSEIVEDTSETIELLFISDIGYSKTVQNFISVYPVAKSMIDTGLKPHRPAEFVLESYNFIELKQGNNENYLTEDLPILKETRYHKIQGKNNKYLVTFKNDSLNAIMTRNIE